MEVVSDAVGVIADQMAIVATASDELSHRELIGLLAELATVMRSVPALEHRILARLLVETEPHRLGESSWKKVLSTALRCSGAEAARRLVRAKTLGPRQALGGEPLAPLWEATAAAQAAGALSEEHVAVIARFHKALPSSVDVGTRAAADAQLAGLGSGLCPEDLAAAATRLAVMIDQDGPEPTLADRLRKRGLSFGRQQADGYSRVSGWMTARCRAFVEAVYATEAAPGRNIPDEAAEQEPNEAVEPAPAAGSQDTSRKAAPGRNIPDQAPEPSPATPSEPSPAEDHDPHPDPRGSDHRTQAQRHHDALEAMARRTMESGDLGTRHGLPATVIVSTTLQDLQNGAGVAVTGGGTLLSMPDLIGLAARAYHYLYVYDGHTGQSLYLGRAKRLASAAQRIVLHARDRGCTRPGCTAPGYWCQAHHAVSDWADDGRTDIDDLALACPADHRMLDHTGWRTSKNATNRTQWHPPPDLDTGQHRTNNYHHPERHLIPGDEDDP